MDYFVVRKKEKGLNYIVDKITKDLNQKEEKVGCQDVPELAVAVVVAGLAVARRGRAPEARRALPVPKLPAPRTSPPGAGESRVRLRRPPRRRAPAPAPEGTTEGVRAGRMTRWWRAPSPSPARLARPPPCHLQWCAAAPPQLLWIPVTRSASCPASHLHPARLAPPPTNSIAPPFRIPSQHIPPPPLLHRRESTRPAAVGPIRASRTAMLSVDTGVPRAPGLWWAATLLPSPFIPVGGGGSLDPDELAGEK
jgi:hypothetical protein